MISGCVDGGKIRVCLNWPSVGIVTWNTTLWGLALRLTPNIVHSDSALSKRVILTRFWTISTTHSERWTKSNSSQKQSGGGDEHSMKFRTILYHVSVINYIPKFVCTYMPEQMGSVGDREPSRLYERSVHGTLRSPN
jgi:hypothetical protein